MRKIRSCWEEKKKLCLYKGQSFLDKVIHNWKVLGYSKTKEKPSGSCVFWKCQCILCGTIKDVVPNNIFSNKSKKCYSCSMKNTSGKNNHNWRGYENIPASLIYSIETSAKSRKIEYNLSKEYLNELWLKQNGKCALSGEIIILKAKNKKDPAWSNRASLDRIDSTKGYLEGNVQWVHPVVNFMKNNFSEQSFITFCEKIYKNSIKNSNINT